MKAPVKAVYAAFVACFIALVLWMPIAHTQDAGSADPATVALDAGTATGPVVAAPVAPAVPAITDPGHDPDFLDKLLKAADTSNWRMLAVLIVIGAVWLLRTVGGKKWAVLKTDRAGAICTLALGTAGAIGNALAAGSDITLRLFINGLMVGITAAGGWVVMKKLFFPSDVKNATPATPATPTPPPTPPTT